MRGERWQKPEAGELRGRATKRGVGAEPSTRAPLCTIHFGLLPSRAVKEHIGLVSNNQICGHLLERPQEPNGGWEVSWRRRCPAEL